MTQKESYRMYTGQKEILVISQPICLAAYTMVCFWKHWNETRAQLTISYEAVVLARLRTGSTKIYTFMEAHGYQKK